MKLFVILILFFGSFQVYAGVQDSTGVQVVKGQRYVVHKIEKKETLYSLSRKYGVSVDAIKKANPGLDTLKIGQTILIPRGAAKETVKTTGAKTHTVAGGETLYSISKKYNVSVDELKKLNKLTTNSLNVGQTLIISEAQVTESKSSIPEYHIVAKGEGLYSIAKKYDLSVDDIIKKNNLSSSSIKVGQKLYLPGGVPEPDPEYHKLVNKPTKTEAAERYSTMKFERISETGSAEVKVSPSLDSEYSYCYHKSLPIGSVVQVINQENGKYVWARVRGRLTYAGGDTILWVNKTVAKRLGQSKTKFAVKITYVK